MCPNYKMTITVPFGTKIRQKLKISGSIKSMTGRENLKFCCHQHKGELERSVRCKEKWCLFLPGSTERNKKVPWQGKAVFVCTKLAWCTEDKVVLKDFGAVLLNLVLMHAHTTSQHLAQTLCHEIDTARPPILPPTTQVKWADKRHSPIVAPILFYTMRDVHNADFAHILYLWRVWHV